MLTSSFAFYFTKNFYLVNEFNEVISNCQSAGLIDYVMSKYTKLTKKIEKQPPSALSYNNLEGFFELFAYGLILSFLSFILEILFGFMKRRKKKVSFLPCVDNSTVNQFSDNRLRLREAKGRL